MFSDRLYNSAEALWLEAANKGFLIDMAKGTLDEERFKKYMIQDYLYLLDYLDILKRTLELSQDENISEFLRKTIADTEYEGCIVHVANMKELGVTEADLKNSVKEQPIEEYLEFMNKQLEEGGLVTGLTALLQCSWNYAFLGEKLSEKYSEVLPDSRYRSWFEAYTREDYIQSNNGWIEMVNKCCTGISEDEIVRLCNVFRTCAIYENKFWDVLYK